MSVTTGLPGLAWAEGYGWTGVSFRYEALSEFLGGKAGSDAANLARVTASVREVLRQQYSEAEAADYLETLRSMMTEGWESAPDRDTKAQQWLVVHIILEYGLLSEFRAESLSNKKVYPHSMYWGSRFSPRGESSIFNLFKYGRDWGKQSPNTHCMYDKGRFAGEPWTGSCLEADLILSPQEVQGLREELEAVIEKPEMFNGGNHVSPEHLRQLRTLHKDVSLAARRGHAMYFWAGN